MAWWMWIVKIIFGILLVLVIVGTSLFGYIAWKARARSWGGGMFGIAALCIFLFYYFIIGAPFWPF